MLHFGQSDVACLFSFDGHTDLRRGVVEDSHYLIVRRDIFGGRCKAWSLLPARSRHLSPNVLFPACGLGCR
ncbi:hypothetical protein E2C01_068961 [Portunus trituberculatus]|uniref:Uncharacterized protein n=1 Tax=Portunus trituberculatus TaxID=210409 RepID=A0A5B7HXM2_PORTR|nr:hypothetical protein [Portunus trituberculatus]